MNNKNNCNKTTNNKYFQCPPRMSDGRHFTDYRSNIYVNDLIRHTNKTGSNYEYRQFLIHNADNLIKMNNDYMSYMNGCNECNAETIPFQTECFINQNYSNCYNSDKNGIGINYKTDSIKNISSNNKLSEISEKQFGKPEVNNVEGYNKIENQYSSIN
jgi:hypothetical protein